MSKQSQVLAAAERIGFRLGASSSQIDSIKRELSTIWGGDQDTTPAAPQAPATSTFNVQVGVEVLASLGARQSDVEAAVIAALDSAASRRDEVVSISVAGA